MDGGQSNSRTLLFYLVRKKTLTNSWKAPKPDFYTMVLRRKRENGGPVVVKTVPKIPSSNATVFQKAGSEKKAVVATEADFRASWKRPKWDIVQK